MSQNIFRFSKFIYFHFLAKKHELAELSYVLPVQQVMSQTHLCLQLIVPLPHFPFSDSAIFLMLILLTFILDSFMCLFHIKSPLSDQLTPTLAVAWVYR